MKTLRMATEELHNSGKVNCDGMTPDDCLALAEELTNTLTCKCTYSGVSNEITAPGDIAERIEKLAQ